MGAYQKVGCKWTSRFFVGGGDEERGLIWHILPGWREARWDEQLQGLPTQEQRAHTTTRASTRNQVKAPIPCHCIAAAASNCFITCHCIAAAAPNCFITPSNPAPVFGQSIKPPSPPHPTPASTPQPKAPLVPHPHRPLFTSPCNQTPPPRSLVVHPAPPVSLLLAQQVTNILPNEFPLGHILSHEGAPPCVTEVGSSAGVVGNTGAEGMTGNTGAAGKTACQDRLDWQSHEDQATQSAIHQGSTSSIKPRASIGEILGGWASAIGGHDKPHTLVPRSMPPLIPPPHPNTHPLPAFIPHLKPPPQYLTPLPQTPPALVPNRHATHRALLTGS